MSGSFLDRLVARGAGLDPAAVAGPRPVDDLPPAPPAESELEPPAQAPAATPPPLPRTEFASPPATFLAPSAPAPAADDQRSAAVSREPAPATPAAPAAAPIASRAPGRIQRAAETGPRQPDAPQPAGQRVALLAPTPAAQLSAQEARIPQASDGPAGEPGQPQIVVHQHRHQRTPAADATPGSAEPPTAAAALAPPGPVTVEIGTIEVRLEPPTPAAAPAAPGHAAAPPAPGFDEYAAIRSYAR